MGAEVKLYACTKMLDWASAKTLTISAVQSSPGVKHIVTVAGTPVALGTAAGGVGAGLVDDISRGWPAAQY
jgi:hypothetical protein